MVLSLLYYCVAIAKDCSPVGNGIVISKYYLDDCPACKKMTPVVVEAMSKIEKSESGIKYREVECTECECEGITSFPTIEITEDKVSKGKTVGYKDYNGFTAWIQNILGLDSSIFENHIEHESGAVKQLSSRDFLSGFDGQWLILFYDYEGEPYREMIKKLATENKEKLNVGEIHKDEAVSVTNRFNIGEYPYLLAVNHGYSVPYSGKKSFEAISNFTERLVTPNFEHITYNKLRTKSRALQGGEPIFVVVYKDFDVASHYFNDLSQQFKFKASIFRSDDAAMFEASGFHPKMAKEFEQGKVDHNQMVQLFVFKNGSFYPYPSTVDNSSELIQWLFHTHFPYVTNIDNDNFFSVFHGIKPVIILLTHGEYMVQQFNKISADRHMGSPFADLVFATLDAQEYPQFTKQILNGIKAPAITFYDPVKTKWYYQYSKLNPDNLNKTVLTMIEKFQSNKLSLHPPEKRGWTKFAFIALLIGACGLIYKISRRTSKEID